MYHGSVSEQNDERICVLFVACGRRAGDMTHISTDVVLRDQMRHDQDQAERLHKEQKSVYDRTRRKEKIIRVQRQKLSKPREFI